MALHDRDILRTMACGIAGLSVVADSLSAIKHAKVHAIRDERGLAVDFRIEGEYPQYGNNDDRVDGIAIELVESFMKKLKTKKTYRDATPTMSILTITSNVVYGKKTGSTPDGRKRANRSRRARTRCTDATRRRFGLADFVAKLPYDYAQDGISNTFSIVPEALARRRKIA
jgi:formate C-acetyltransferase